MTSVAGVYLPASWFPANTGTLTVTGVAWSAGDIIVVAGGTEDRNSTLGVPTNANLTFTQRAASGQGVTDESPAYIWTATAASSQTGQTISSTKAGAAGLDGGLMAWVITGSPSGIGNTAANAAESGLSLATSAGSIVLYFLADWNAANTNQTVATGSGTATERADFGNSSTWGGYAADWVNTAATTTTYGPTSYTGLKVNQVAVEILAPAGPTPSSGTFALADVRDTAAFSGTVGNSTNGILTQVDGVDTIDISAWASSARSNEALATTNSESGTSTGTITQTDGRDVLAISGTVTPVSIGSISVSDTRDLAVLRDVSVVVTENLLPGETDAGQYTIGGAGDLNNQGFARQTSVNAGETIDFAVDGDCEVITIYRIGHYGGDNWREVTEITNTPTNQSNGSTIPNSNGATSMASWTNTASWVIPENTVSGMFVAVVRNAALNNGSWIPFVVRNDSRSADIVIGIPTSTWAAAYNYYGTPASPTGGRCLYGFGLGNINDRSLAVSYDRPIVSRASVVNHWDNYESAAIDWFEENGYDVKYVTSEDLHGRPEVWANANTYVSVGHDEYWSQEMRDNVEAFRDAGGNCLFMSANEIFWKIRYSTDMRTIWCYKDTMAGPTGYTRSAGDPFDPVSWTGTWRDTRWVDSNPESYLTGTFFRMNGISWRDPVISTATYGDNPFWRNTSVETTNLTLTDGVGFEADEVDIRDARSSVILAGAVINIDGVYANDDGETYSNNGSMNPWGIVMHQTYDNEGVVVGFGTMAWLWKLSDFHRDQGPVSSVACQQATVNLLTDLGAQPYSLRTVELSEPTPVALSVYGLSPIPAETTGQFNLISADDALSIESWLTSARSNQEFAQTLFLGPQIKFWNGSAWVTATIRHGAGWPEVRFNTL